MNNMNEDVRELKENMSSDSCEHLSSDIDDDLSESEITFSQTTALSEVKDQMIPIDISMVLEVHGETNKIPRSVREKILDFEICMDWNVPLAHSFEESLRYDGSKNIRESMKNANQELKLSPFTAEEDAMLLQNWSDFQQEYGFDDPKYFLPGFVPRNIFQDKKKRSFVQYLGRNINHRTLRSIYNRFYEIFSEENTGRFTYAEDQFILGVNFASRRYFDKHTSKIKVLESLLGRKKVAIKRRLKKLETYSQRGGFAAPVTWNIKLCKKLIQALVDHKQDEYGTDLENIHMTPDDWKKIGSKLGISDIHLEYFWKYHLSGLLFTRNSISKNRLRCFLIIWFLNHSSIKNWDDISWADVSSSLSAPEMLCCRVFYNMISTYVPEDKWPNLRDCIDHLYKHYIDLFSSNKLKDRYYKRLNFTDY